MFKGTTFKLFNWLCSPFKHVSDIAQKSSRLLGGSDSQTGKVLSLQYKMQLASSLHVDILNYLLLLYKIGSSPSNAVNQ